MKLNFSQNCSIYISEQQRAQKGGWIFREEKDKGHYG